MSAVRGLNHITLAVRDVDRAVQFYVHGLGFALRKQWAEGAYLEAGSLWLCLSLDDTANGGARQDYTHIAFDSSAGEFHAIKRRISAAGGREWKDNKSEGDSFYFTDPDGHKLELHVGTLQTRLRAMAC